ncbi:MAG: DVU_1556 family methyltransferase [Pseudomonadota bacterium]
MSPVNLYESDAMRVVTGPLIRPGGFAVTDRGLACCPLTAGDRVLDVGCGTGAVVDYLRRHHGLAAAGIDLCAALLTEGAKAHGGAPLMRGRAEQLPVAAGRFSAVLSECVLSLCADPHAVLREAWRVLIPGGHLILTDIYARMPVVAAVAERVPVNSCLRGAVDRLTVESRIAAAGFDGVFWEDHTPALIHLAAEMVWNFGSLDEFWAAVGGPDTAAAMSRGGGCGCRRPGYYLLVARKCGG